MIYRDKGSIRLKRYDYRSPGNYFITICTYCREKIFGQIEKNTMVLNDFGKIAYNEWIKTAQIRENMELDSFVMMPDHMHGILRLINSNNKNYCRRMMYHAPTIMKSIHHMPIIMKSTHRAPTIPTRQITIFR